MSARRSRFPRSFQMHGDLGADGTVFDSRLDAWVPLATFDVEKEVDRWAGEYGRTHLRRADRAANACDSYVSLVICGLIVPPSVAAW